MYNPPAFREDRPEVLREIMRAARLALLVSAATILVKLAKWMAPGSPMPKALGA